MIIKSIERQADDILNAIESQHFWKIKVIRFLGEIVNDDEDDEEEGVPIEDEDELDKDLFKENLYEILSLLSQDDDWHEYFDAEIIATCSYEELWQIITIKDLSEGSLPQDIYPLKMLLLLEKLVLPQCVINFEIINQLKHLQYLSMYGITPEYIDIIKQLNTLKKLTLRLLYHPSQQEYYDNLVERLKSYLPNCDVVTNVQFSLFKM